MKRILALAFTIALFTAPAIALAEVDHLTLSQIFDGYEESILHGGG